MERSRRVELLSPAGNEEGFYGAVHAGADEVYLAGARFGARAYADNFTTDSLVACIRYAHLLGRKIYLTVNTLLKGDELSELYDYLQPFYEAGLDAVIVQDLGVLRFIREHFPKLKLHVSTQMTLCSSYGAALLKGMGASRIVPARELGLQELAVMRRQADIEIEAFIHGAMCYCYSGQCLFSSILGGRSGNRGRCVQPCRLPYSVSLGGTKQKESYPLSLKDMCTIEHIPVLIEAGIDSFKIEGRMKKPEYTAGVTAVYRRYIDLYYKLREDKGAKEAAEAYHVDKADLELLSSLYIRSGIQDGYYFRHGGREMITLESPAYSGSNEKELAKIRGNYIDVQEKMPVSVKAVFRVGQPAEAVYTWADRDNHKPVRRAVHVTGNIVEHAGKQPITLDNIRKQLGKLGDSTFQISDMEIIADKDSFYPLKQINELRRTAIAKLEDEILSARGYSPYCPAESVEQEVISLDIFSDEPAPEKTCAAMVEVVPGDQDHYEDNLADANLDGFKTTGMAGEQCCTNPAKEQRGANPVSIRMRAGQRCHVISVCTLPQLKAVADWFSREKADRPLRLYIEGDLFLSRRQEVLDACNNMPTESSFYLTLPYILRESDRHYLEQLSSAMQESGIFRGFLVRSMDGLGFIQTLSGRKLCCRADAGVYAWNQQAVQELSSYVEGFCLPYELKGSEQRQLQKGLSCEKIVYGRIPMMLTANCLFRTFRQCRKTDKAENDNTYSQACGKPDESVYKSHVPKYAILKDRYRRDFPVVANCLHCMNIIYNTVPLSLYQSISKWKERVDLRMDFTLESPDEVKAILDSFLKGAPFPLKEYTTGHEKRGVE